ncbi:LLM class flavin-dependent oxidoreductase [Acidovorax sp. RAC01]|uniref:LLM class flavin-dependent oxidoreductase n=1 Tax=Acidovorax sp. RAC01 TaxID=1842533 RepID=UPI0018D2C923|nr:LLM class flavin-dependent oxidoreductase [Acidovorax sp. RAC01]
MVAQRPEVWPYPNTDFDPVLATTVYNNYIEQLVYAEECGFDWVGIGEDHFTAYSITPNPNLIISILSQRTKRVKFAILGAPLPLLNPIRLAEECAMLDVLSNGRLIVGFIRGVPQNYAAYNVDPNESRDRFDQARDLILKAWASDEIFAWKSSHYDFPKVSLWPKPVQQPHPPLIFSANSAPSAVLAAKSKAIAGTIHMYNLNALDQVAESILAYKTQATADGWEAGSDRFLIGLQVCIADTDEEAKNLLTPALDYQFKVLSGTFNAQKREIAKTTAYGHTPTEEHPPTFEERLAAKIILCGSPSTVVQQIKKVREMVGVGTISLHFQVGNMKDEHVRKGMTLFRDKVLPNFR